MRLVLDPRRLVARVAELISVKFSNRIKEQLTLSISAGLGVAREGFTTRLVYAMLGSVLEAEAPSRDFCPTLVRGELQRTKERRKVRGTYTVISWFRYAERRVGTDDRHFERWCIPIADDSLAIVPLGGDINDDEDVVHITTRPDGVEVKWFTLRNVPTDGGIIYRVYREKDGIIKVALYQRLAENAWVRAVFDGSEDLVNLPQLLASMAGAGNRFDSVEEVAGPTPLIRPLPTTPYRPR